MMNKNKLHFLALTALSLAAVALAGVFGLAPHTGAMAAPAAQTTEASIYPLMEALPELTCIDTGAALQCELWAIPGTIGLPGGATADIWGFADNAAGPAQLPGPIIRAQVGQTLEITLHNEIVGQAVSLSFPGQNGVIPDLAGAGATGTVSYTLQLNQAGTFTYEAGLTENGSRQVPMGLVGPLIVEDGTEPGDQEIVLVLSEIDPGFNANPMGFSMFTFRPKYWLLNGHAFPQTGDIEVVPGSSVLLRLINTGVQTHPIGVLGLNQQVIAADGVDLAVPWPVGTVPNAPGQTHETLIQIPNLPAGTLFPVYDTGLSQHNNSQTLPGNRIAFGGMLTFLRIAGDPTTTLTGPVPSNVAVTPSKTGGQENVILSATFTDDDGNVTAFEYFIDSLGAAGTGTLVDGFVPANPANVSTTITTDILAGLSGGQHIFYVRGKDSTDIWGVPGSVVLTLDKNGPLIIGLGTSPNPTNGTQNVVLSGTADDRTSGNSLILGAEWQMDNGGWMPMVIQPLNATLTGLSATIPAEAVAVLSEGIHPIQVRAWDMYNNYTDPVGTTALRVDKTGPTVPSVTLSTTLIDLSKPLPTTVRLTAYITDTLSGGISSTLVSAEGFIDTAGAPGTGFALYPLDGLFDEVGEDVYYNIPGAAFGSLSPGDHYVLVKGKDLAGNWGPAGSAMITILAQVEDLVGPTITNPLITPSTVTSGATVTLTGTATDLLSNVAGAAWFEGTKPTKKLFAMSAADGSFNSKVENLTATFTISKRPGVYPYSMRAYDAAGNWGPIVTVYLTVTK